jgi:Transposase zinc-binding domain
LQDLGFTDRVRKRQGYRRFQTHFETWLALASSGQFDGQGDHYTPPRFVEQAFRKYLECGVFAHGFARARCGDCDHDFIVAFSCKGRGVCPSCCTRRMNETAAHLVEHVLPVQPVRQWVLSVPKRLRYFMQRDTTASNCLRLFLRAIRSALIERSKTIDDFTIEEINKVQIGAVAFIHRFSSDITCKQVSLLCNFVVMSALSMAFSNQPTKACSFTLPSRSV